MSLVVIGGCQAKAVESRSYLVVVLGFGADVSRLEVSHEAVSVQVTTGGHWDTSDVRLRHFVSAEHVTAGR